MYHLESLHLFSAAYFFCNNCSIGHRVPSLGPHMGSGWRWALAVGTALAVGFQTGLMQLGLGCLALYIDVQKMKIIKKCRPKRIIIMRHAESGMSSAVSTSFTILSAPSLPPPAPTVHGGSNQMGAVWQRPSESNPQEPVAHCVVVGVLCHCLCCGLLLFIEARLLLEENKPPWGHVLMPCPDLTRSHGCHGGIVHRW